MSEVAEETEVVVDPLLKYEKAKRNGQVEKFKVSTRYGKFFFWTGTPQAKQEVLDNMTTDYFDGPWLRQIPVEIRNKMCKLRWADIGSNSGWFAFKLVMKLMPKVVYCLEPADARYSFLTHNHMNNDRNNTIGKMFKLLVPEKKYGVSVATIKLNAETGLADVNGTVEQIVPILAYDDLVIKHNLNALRFNISGYEKDVLLKADLSRIKIILARIVKSNYTSAEFKKLKKKLKKEYDFFRTLKTDVKGEVYMIAYRKEMVQEV